MGRLAAVGLEAVVRRAGPGDGRTDEVPATDKGADDPGTGSSTGADCRADDAGSISDATSSMTEESISDSGDDAVDEVDVGSRRELDLALFPMVSTAPTSIPTVTLSAAAVIAIPARRCTAPHFLMPPLVRPRIRRDITNASS